MPNDALAITLVLDEEIFFRVVADDQQLFAIDGSGNLRLSGSVFNDRLREPSIDRAAMLQGGAEAARKSASDGVVCLIACEVRAVKTVVTLDQKQKPVHHHDVDVVHDPVEGNAAHAVVRTAPALVSDSAFRRLKEALCLLASSRGWAHLPASVRPQSAAAN